MEPDGRKEARPFILPAWMAEAHKQHADILPAASERQADGDDHAFPRDQALPPLSDLFVSLREGIPHPTSEKPAVNIVEQAKPVRQPAGVHKPEDARRDSHIDSRNERRKKKETARIAKRADKAQNNKGTSSTASASASPPSPNSPPTFSSLPPSPVESSASGTTSGPTEVTATDVHQRKAYVPWNDLHQWYSKVIKFETNELMRRRKRPQELAALDALKNCIKRCEDKTNQARLETLYDELRDYVHKAEATLQINRAIAKFSKILTTDGLPRIFIDGADFPSDLKDDAYQLYTRWMNDSFEYNLLRGIITKKGKDRNGDSIDLKYKENHPSKANIHGEGDDLILGQWWPTQLCCVRDGVHGASQGGIFGNRTEGTYSIVPSGGGYHDTDDGKTIEYSGTEGKNFKTTETTQEMITSANYGHPVRVIRSAQLAKSNNYRPELGLRYDGLYVVKGYKEIYKEKQMYRFTLERCPSQAPIRCGGKEDHSRRPTAYEIAAYDELKEKMKW